MAISKPWLCVCLVWATLGGTFLYFIDHSLLGGVIWLAVAFLIGLYGAEASSFACSSVLAR